MIEILYTVIDRGDPDNCSGPAAECATAKTGDEKKVTNTVKPVDEPSPPSKGKNLSAGPGRFR